MRKFETGATRDQDDTKPDYRGFLCPLVIRRFGEYMLEHQRQADGTKRASDNWKKGIPSKAYLESLLRHVRDLQEQFEFGEAKQYIPPAASRDFRAEDIKRYEDTLAAILFNAQGLLRNSLLGHNYQNYRRFGAAEEAAFNQYIVGIQSPGTPLNIGGRQGTFRQTGPREGTFTESPPVPACRVGGPCCVCQRGGPVSECCADGPEHKGRA